MPPTAGRSNGNWPTVGEEARMHHAGVAATAEHRVEEEEVYARWTGMPDSRMRRLLTIRDLLF